MINSAAIRNVCQSLWWISIGGLAIVVTSWGVAERFLTLAMSCAPAGSATIRFIAYPLLGGVLCGSTVPQTVAMMVALTEARCASSGRCGDCRQSWSCRDTDECTASPGERLMPQTPLGE